MALVGLGGTFEGGAINLRRPGVSRESAELVRQASLLLGLGLPDDNAHSPNEKFSLDAFAKGMAMSARLWQELAR